MSFESKFKVSKEALGHFWPQNETNNIWEGRLRFDVFPTLEIISLSDQDIGPKDTTLHGVSRDAEYFSLFTSNISRGDWYLSPAIRSDGLEVPFSGKARTVYVDYMLAGSNLYSREASVKRVSFYSEAASDAFGVWPDPTFSDLKFRRTSSGFRQPRLRKTVRSILVNQPLPMRIRCISSAVPANKDERCQFVISFVKEITPHEALVQMLSFRDLLTFLSGVYLDLSDPRFRHIHTDCHSDSHIFFGDPRRAGYVKKIFSLAILPLMANQDTFSQVIRRWAEEKETYRRARRVFNDIILDDDRVTFSHLRELVTIIEMIVNEDAILISAAQFRKLRKALNATVQQFIQSDPSLDAKTARGVESIAEKFHYLNKNNASAKILLAIDKIPEVLRNELFEDAKVFSRDVIKIRDYLTHDMSRLSAKDYLDTNWYVVKLKALYAINEAIRLSSASSINKFCAIIRDGISIGLKPPSAVQQS